MLKILPIQSKKQQEADCAMCGVPFRPDALAYRATVDDVLVGICQFKLTDQGGEIYELAPAMGQNDFEAMFIMGRAALNFIDLCGVHYAKYLSDTVDVGLLRGIGFRLNQEQLYDIDLTNFFDHPCQHKKETEGGH